LAPHKAASSKPRLEVAVLEQFVNKPLWRVIWVVVLAEPRFLPADVERAFL
jgi:hypothetical protein